MTPVPFHGVCMVLLVATIGCTCTAKVVQYIKDDGRDGWVTLPGHRTTFKIIEPGSGPAVSVGARVTVHTTGVITESGRLFWSTKGQSQEPYTYHAGIGEVIQGWDKGCLGMLLGETRQFEIPAEEAYGAKGHNDFRIPPHAALVYEIKILRLEGGEAGITAEVPGLMKEYDRDL
eukprot:m.102099 g.102099  ORF g.102099 m.102099 type:complete len:175 (-) comp20793_c0_seq4:1315-1839(-)